GARALANMVALLGERFRFFVVTRNHDVGDRQPFPDRPSNAWVRTGHADVFYAADRDLTLRQLLHRVNEVNPRVVYLNSMFSVLAIRMLLLRRAGFLSGRALAVAPEGELGAGALATRTVRKRLYLLLARSAGFFRGVLWKAASEPEAELIRSWFGAGEPVHVVASLSVPSPPPAPKPVALPSGGGHRELDLIFLSRLGPKKNLHFLLAALRSSRKRVHLGLAGPIADAAYWRRCERELARLPANVRVTQYGALHPDEVPGVLGRFDVFALPTLDENYGYVILEALAAGCFLLISPHTPWADVERAGVGRILDVDDPARWGAAIDALADRPDEEFERSRDLTAAYARRHLSSLEAPAQLERFLADASGRSLRSPTA
ncbi:MAG: glycosyltransferase, partial [Thermoanaerobaculia bacterium]